MKHRVAFNIFFAFMVGVLPAYATEEAITVSDVWARPSYSTHTKNGVVYLTLKSRVEDTLTAVTSTIAEHTQLHEMREEEGRFFMRHLQALPLPAGEEVQLKPGGYHVMLLGLKRPLKVGETFLLTLQFASSPAQKVQVKVKHQK